MNKLINCFFLISLTLDDRSDPGLYERIFVHLSQPLIEYSLQEKIVVDRPFIRPSISPVCSSTSIHPVKIFIVRRPWSKKSYRPPQNDNLGGWTGRRSLDGRLRPWRPDHR